jgi:hypothetical protein
MANTFTLIQTVTVGSGGTASIDFSSIPNTYTDLILKLSSRGTNNDAYYALNARFNASSATSQYYTRGVGGNGSGLTSDGQNGLSYFYTVNPNANSATANTFGNTEFYFPNYASSSNKSVSVDSVGENDATVAFQQFQAGQWLNTSAINQITLTNEYGNFAQYTTAHLYGILKS